MARLVESAMELASPSIIPHFYRIRGRCRGYAVGTDQMRLRHGRSEERGFIEPPFFLQSRP